MSGQPFRGVEPPEVEAIPAELRDRDQWVLWRFEDRDGKQTKAPWQARNPRARASSTNPDTWAPFAETVEALEQGHGDGLGFVFTESDPFAGIDLDGELSEAEQGAIIAALASYAERSVSGAGYHVLLRAELPAGGRHPPGIGVFDRGRYFVVTGDHVQGTPTAIEARQAELERVLEEYLPKREEREAPAEPQPVDVDDEELLERARRARNGADFERLWRGDTAGYPSHSEADLALCSRLAFWTGRDAGRVDRLFRASGLMRPKWDERRGDSTYGTQTVEEAIAGCRDVYTPKTRRRPAVPPASLEEVLETYKRWLYLPDPGALLAVLGATAANMLDGDPVWLLLVGPPGSGKTEMLGPLAALELAHPAATLTEAALLSGTAARDRDPGARGGLLRIVGDFGIIVCKDFGSVLSMGHETRAATLAALREVYDGAWTRLLGTGGGKVLHWAGKVGLLAGCTPTIDRHHAVMAAMGERFVLYRIAEADAAEQARASLRHAGREETMRQELRRVVAGLFAGGLREPRAIDEGERERLVSLALLITRCRSAVERDRYTRDVEVVGAPEAPTRLVVVLERLLAGLDAIGVEREEAWRVVTKAALDSAPALRMAVVDELYTRGRLSTPRVAEAVRYPSNTTRRALEDLAAHGVAIRHPKEQNPEGRRHADEWELSEFAREHYGRVQTVPAFAPHARSESLETQSESGKEPSSAPLSLLPDSAGTDSRELGEEGLAWR